MPEFIDRNGNKMEVDAPGVIKLFAGDTPPEGHLVCNGSAISRAAYPELFAAIGTRYGAGDGVSTFNLPNTEDRFPRFAGGELVVGEKQGDAIRNIEGAFNIHGGNNSGTGTGSIQSARGVMLPETPQDKYSNPAFLSGTNSWATVRLDTSLVVPTADENRPKAIALLACIRY